MTGTKKYQNKGQMNTRISYMRAMSTSLMPISFMWMVRYGMMAKEAPLKKKRVHFRGSRFMFGLRGEL